MAEGVINLALDGLVKVAATRIASLLGLKEDLDFLSSEFSAIKNVLQDAETRQISEESVRSWLQKLKFVAYDLEDLLEDWRILEVDAVTSSPFTNCFGADQVRNSSSSNWTSLIKHPIRHCKYRKRVDQIRRRLEQILRERSNYQFSSDTPVRRMREERRTGPFVDQTSVVGRDEDKKTLISKLVSEEGLMTCGSGDMVPTIFILGMGGLGKTTLAKSIYNDEIVQKHFGEKYRMWVCVGEVFDREAIMKSMIKTLDKNADDSHQLREQLAEMLKDGPYLLILDDVWNENYLKLEPLLEILNQGAKGSRIVITTRNTGVVDNIRSAYTHELKGLGDDQCLSIFKKVVIEPGKEEEYEPLMDIGREIVKKCGGLPLAVKTVASALRGRRVTREQWENVLNSKIWDLKISEEGKEGILPALMLSYTELTPQLKNCFGYCSIFEKDTILEKDELVRLWVSQGYIVINDGQSDEEKVGEECFDELLARSMFQEPERDEERSSIARCKMHDLVHDLAQWVTKEECCVIVSRNDANNNNNALSQLAGARHCVIKPEVSLGDISLAGVEKLRTLIYSHDDDEPIEIDRVLKLLKAVRVLKIRNCNVGRHEFKHLGKLVHLRNLDLSNTRLKQLPAASIRKLKELRYLDLSNTEITTLPENISSLSSLRQLKVEGCEKLVKLPKEIVSLPQLQVINLEDCYDLEELPEGISAMASLRQLNIERCFGLKKLPQGFGRRDDVVVMFHTFPVVAAGRDAGEGCSSNIGELGGLKRGRFLNIRNLEKVGSRDEARTAKLEEKTDLHYLVLSWDLGGNEMDDVTVAAADGVLEGLRPPPQLRSLDIRHYPGQTFPGWMRDGGAFRHLREVELDRCKNATQLPPLGQLPRLEELTIAGLWGVRRVGREFLGGPSPSFPCLRSLEFRDMRNWSEWVALPPTIDDEEGSAGSPVMPQLERLDFIGYPKLEAMPPTIDDEEGSAGSTVMPQLETLDIFNCPKLEAMPPIFTTSLRVLRMDENRAVDRSSLQFLPLYKSIIISGHREIESRDGALNPSINVCIGGKETELPGWLLHQTALRILKLVDLPHLRSLPEELTQLTHLQQLLINDCPELRGRCRVGGELLPRIAHIPHIQIDGQDIQC